MAQGTVKHFDIEERTGSLLLDSGEEVQIVPVSTEGTEIRYLRIGQRVDFDVVDEDGRKVAKNLHIVTFV